MLNILAWGMLGLLVYTLLEKAGGAKGYNSIS